MTPPLPHLKAGGEGPNLAASYGGSEGRRRGSNFAASQRGGAQDSPPLTSRQAAKVQTSLPAMVISKAGGESQTPLPAGGGSPYSPSTPQGGRRGIKLRCRLWHFKGRRRRPNLRCQPKEAGGEDQTSLPAGGRRSILPLPASRRAARRQTSLPAMALQRQAARYLAASQGKGPWTLSLTLIRQAAKLLRCQPRGGARPPLSSPRDRLSAMRSPAPGPGPLGGSRNTRVLGVGQPLSPILGARGRRQTLQRATHPRPPQHRGGLCRRCIACVGAASPRPRTRGGACPRSRCTVCTPRSEARPLASP